MARQDVPSWPWLSYLNLDIQTPSFRFCFQFFHTQLFTREKIWMDEFTAQIYTPIGQGNWCVECVRAGTAELQKR
jgi:hypothetical protein